MYGGGSNGKHSFPGKEQGIVSQRGKSVLAYGANALDALLDGEYYRPIVFHLSGAKEYFRILLIVRFDYGQRVILLEISHYGRCVRANLCISRIGEICGIVQSGLPVPAGVFRITAYEDAVIVVVAVECEYRTLVDPVGISFYGFADLNYNGVNAVSVLGGQRKINGAARQIYDIRFGICKRVYVLAQGGLEGWGRLLRKLFGFVICARFFLLVGKFEAGAGRCSEGG